MAADTVVRFSCTVIDETGIKANTAAHLYVDGTSTLADTITALQTWSEAVDDITGGQLVNNSFTIIPALPAGHKTAPVAGSEVQEVATFDFTQDVVTFHWGSTIPSFLETLETADHKPDNAATEVAAYITLLLAAVLGGNYTGTGANPLAAFSYSFLATRKHRRAQHAISFNPAP
jgi:hypothetical protein